MKRKQTDSSSDKEKSAPAKKQKKEEKEPVQESNVNTGLAFDDDENGFPGYIKKTVMNSKGKTTTLELYIPETSYRPSATVFTSAEKALFPNNTDVAFPEPYKHFLTNYNGGPTGSSPAYIKPEAISSLREEEADQEPEPLAIACFCALFDVKKGREEDINEDDDDDDENDDDEGDEFEDIVKLMKSYGSLLPPNLLTVAQTEVDEELALIVINVAKSNPDFGKVYLITFHPPDGEDPALLSSSTTNNDKEEPEVPQVTTLLANNFDEFLTLFMSRTEYQTWKSADVKKRLTALEGAQFQGELKRFVEQWKRKYPLIESHLRYICREFIKQQDSIYNSKTGISPNHILFRLFTFALFFLQKEKHLAAQKKNSKKKNKGGRGGNKGNNNNNNNKEGGEGAEAADELSGEAMLDIFNWLFTYFVTNNPDAVGLTSFIDPKTIEDILHYPGAFEDVDPISNEGGEEEEESKQGTTKPKNKPKANKSNDEDDEDEDDDSMMMDQSIVLKYRISEAKRRRMERILSREVETDKQRDEKWIKESGEVSEEGKGVLKTVFERFDKDKDGFLNVSEWNEYLTASGEKVMNEETWRGFVELVNFRLEEEEMMLGEEEDEEGEEGGEGGKKKGEKEDGGLSLAGWMLVCADAIMMSPEKEREQLEKLGFKISADKFL